MAKEILENPDASGKSCKGVEVPTDREVEILKEMRNIKGRVKKLKAKMSIISNKEGKADQSSQIAGEMARLKAEWSELDEKRKAAAHERMVLLGHEET